MRKLREARTKAKENHSLAFGSYHYYLYIYSAFVPGGRNSNSTPAQSALIVYNLNANRLKLTT